MLVSEVPDLISTRKLAVLAIALVAMVPACSGDPNLPPPPAKPAQINLAGVYTKKSDDQGRQIGLPSNDVYAFLLLGSGQFWVGTAAGIAMYKDTKTYTHSPDAIVNEVNGLPHPQVRSMIEYNGKVYVGTWGGGLGVYDIAGNSWTQIRPGSTGLTDGFVAEISASITEDRLYLATNDGVFIYNPTAATFSHFSTVDTDLDPDDLDTPRLQALVSSVEVTAEAGVVQRWYGPRVETKLSAAQVPLHGITVSKSASTVYKYTETNSGLVEPNVNDIYFDPVRNTYWVSYVGKGISEVSLVNKTWKSYTLVQGLPSNTVNSVTRAGHGSTANTIWAGTQNGLAKLGTNNWQSYGISGGLPAQRVRRVYSDNGSRLWVGFADGGAVRIAF